MERGKNGILRAIKTVDSKKRKIWDYFYIKEKGVIISGAVDGVIEITHISL